MSEENVRTIRSAFDAYNRRDFEGATASFHPEIEWHFPPMALEFETLRGKDEVIGFWRSLDEVFEDFVLIPVDFKASGGEIVLAHLRFTGRGRGSGAPTEIDWHIVYRFRDGAIWRADYFADREQALEAAGLSE